MIPKIIHYCWLSGDPIPENLQKCMNSWKKFLPDYEFILWDRNRFDINSTLWTKQAFEAKNTLSQLTTSVCMRYTTMAAYTWIWMWK